MSSRSIGIVTSCGVPLGSKRNCGRPGSLLRRMAFLKRSLAIESGLILGTALVHRTTASQFFIAAVTSLSTVVSARTTCKDSAPTFFKALTAFRDRTSPKAVTLLSF